MTLAALLPALQMEWSDMCHYACGEAEMCHHPSCILELAPETVDLISTERGSLPTP